jgi:hypothetical protein
MSDEDAAHAALLRRLATDPRTRRIVTKAIKEIDPENYRDHAFPDQKVEDLKEEMEARLAELESKRKIEQADEILRKQKQELLNKYSDEQISEIEKIMEKHNISDYELASKVYAADTPQVDPKRSPRPTQFGERWQFPENMEEFKKDPAGAALRGAYADIDRLRRGERLT